MSASELTTGLPGLDQVLHGLMPGDSLVWQVESLADFTPFVIPYCQAALAQGRNLIYFRFADHDPLVPESLGATVHELPRDAEFEPFVTEMHRVIQASRAGGRVRLRLPLEPRRFLAHRPDAGQLLHARLPQRPRQPIAGLFPPDPPPPQLPRLDPHRRHDANPDRRLSARRAISTSIRPRSSTASRPR